MWWYRGTLRFSRSRSEEAKRKRTSGRTHQVQSEAIIEVSESDFHSETSITASDWLGAFKGPNVCKGCNF